MKEVYITEENEHFILLNKLYKKLPCNEIEKILDCVQVRLVCHHY